MIFNNSWGTIFQAYIPQMPPKSSNEKSAYKSIIKLDLEKLKNGEIQAAKVDLSKIEI